MLEAAPTAPLPARLARCPPATFRVGGMDVRRATSFRARLLGLAGLRALGPHVGLLLPRTRSVHTFGMCFALDLVWLDADGEVVRLDESVAPWRVRSCRAAAQVVELRADSAATSLLATSVANGYTDGMADRVAPQRELRNHYATMLREVERGAEITITRDGRPVARLVPATRRKRTASREEMVAMLGGPTIDAAAFLADVRPPDAERLFEPGSGE